MKTQILKSSSFALLAVCLFSGAPAPRAHAQSTSTPAKKSGFTRDLVYLNTPGGYVNVTSSVYTSQGQTYAVLNNVVIPILLDSSSATVFSPSGSVIGFTVPVTN